MTDVLVPGQLINNHDGKRGIYSKLIVEPDDVYVIDARLKSRGPWLVVSVVRNPFEPQAFFSFVLSAADMGWYWVYDNMQDKLRPIDETPDDVVLNATSV